MKYIFKGLRQEIMDSEGNQLFQWLQSRDSCGFVLPEYQGMSHPTSEMPSHQLWEWEGYVHQSSMVAHSHSLMNLCCYLAYESVIDLKPDDPVRVAVFEFFDRYTKWHDSSGVWLWPAAGCYELALILGMVDPPCAYCTSEEKLCTYHADADRGGGYWDESQNACEAPALSAK